MKKNTMMRIASVLLVAVLLSTCTISGTFAKYVTSDDASDSARVAKWGVNVAVTGSAFATTYETNGTVLDKSGNAIANSVVSTVKVVAPGTSGSFSGISVTGTPEVAVNIANVATLSLSNNWLVDDDDDPATEPVFYCPIVITVNGTDISGLDYASAAAFAAAVKAAIEDVNGNYAAGTDLSTVTGLNGSFAWAWAFVDATGSEINQSDAYDTQLGNLAVGNNLTISLSVSTTVTQID